MRHTGVIHDFDVPSKMNLQTMGEIEYYHAPCEVYYPQNSFFPSVMYPIQDILMTKRHFPVSLFESPGHIIILPPFLNGTIYNAA